MLRYISRVSALSFASLVWLTSVAAVVAMGAVKASAQECWGLPSVQQAHPRLGLTPEGAGIRTVPHVRRLYAEHETFRRYFGPALEQAEEWLNAERADAQPRGAPHVFAACWVATGDDRYAETALNRLIDGRITLTHASGYYSNVWQFGLAYDWLFHHSLMTEPGRRAIEDRIAEALREELKELDGGYPAVWHGRNQLANGTLVAALALSEHPEAEELQRRAMLHFADAVRALDLAEGWPEGPSYWIYNRAFPYALAADCFMTATEEDAIGGVDIRRAIRTIAHWQLYAMSPDGTMARYGDSWSVGPARNRGLWQPVEDYYARIARDPELVAAADYFRTFGDRHYHPGRWAWSAVLAYEPELPMPAEYDASRPAEYLNEHLPRARVFGRFTHGQAFLVERWGDPDATWISFKAGDLLAHHGHYDQGTFTVYRGSPVAVHSGHYGDYFGAYRLGYYIQTVAANSLLVRAPEEFSTFAREHGYHDSIAGGQRVVMPTGCDITSVSDWLRSRCAGAHYEAADMTAFESSPGAFDYAAADITAAYNSTRYAEPGNPAKVESVVRKLVYLRDVNAVVVFDQLVTTDPEYDVSWLLHTPAKPQTEQEELSAGESPDDGVLATDDHWLHTAYERGELWHQVLLPGSAQVLKVGGPTYRYAVELADGWTTWGEHGQRDDSPEQGLWRVEVRDGARGRDYTFLNVLWPRLSGQDAPERARLAPAEPPALAVSVGGWVTVFGTEGELSGTIVYQAPEGAVTHLVADLEPRSQWRIESAAGTERRFASEDGVLSFAAGAGLVRMSEIAPRDGSGHQ